MAELRIYDSMTSDQEMLVPLHVLIDALEQVAPDASRGSWRIHRGAWGSGPWVSEVEDRLERQEELVFDHDRVFGWLKKEGEIFYDVVLSHVGSGLEIGVFDSTYLFIKAPTDLLQALRRRFRTVELHDDDSMNDSADEDHEEH
jgi:hypothetical protein